MTRSIFAAAAAALTLCGVAQADFYAVGSTNGWDINGAPAMVEGPAGVWTYAYSDAPNAKAIYNIVATLGDWGSQVYPSDTWTYADGAGNASLTLDTNTYNDGWSPASNRLYASNIPHSSWTVTGGFLGTIGGSDWDNGSPQGLMSFNGSYFTWSAIIPDGTYDFKIVGTGSWDSISVARSTAENAPNDQFTTGGGLNYVRVEVDPANGRSRVYVAPAPGTAAFVGIAGVLGLRRRR